MTEEERLQEYFKQHAPTEQEHGKSKSAKTPFKKIPLNPDAETPLRWYVTDTLFFVIKALFATVGITFFTLLIVDSLIYKIQDDQTDYIFLFALGLLLLFLLIRTVRLIYYLRWINGNLYPLEGWDDFLAKRRNKFWKGAFTNIRISVTLSPNASHDDRKLTDAHLKKWAAQWANRYKKMEWAPGSGKPDDFVSDGKSIHGDISERGLHRLVYKMLFYMPSLTNKLGSQLEMISITSGHDEHEYTSVKVKDDAYDRNTTRELRRSLRE